MNQQLIGSFPTYSPTSTKQLPIQGLTPGHEVHGLQVQVEGTVASTSTAFNGAPADINAILAALFNKWRLTYNGVTDAWNITSAELRSIAVAFTGRDISPYFYGNTGAATPNPQVPATGSAAVVKLCLFLPFHHRGLENPALFAPSSDQLNVPGSHLDYDSGAGGTTITLANGAAAFVVSDVKVYAVLVRVAAPYIAPTILCRSKSIAQSIDTEQGAAVDLLVADERSPTTLEAQVQQVSIVRDGVYGPRNSTPKNLATLYQLTQVCPDGSFDASYDITQGLNRSGASIGVQPGAQLSPLIWVAAGARADEREIPAWLDHRQIQQNLASGGSAAATYLFCQVKTIDQAESYALSLMGQYRVAGGLRDLPIKGGGGGDNGVNAAFKPRWIAAKGS